MSTLTFSSTDNLTPDERWSKLFRFIGSYKSVIVEFRKVNGELRNMLCTTDPTLMPAHAVTTHHKTHVINNEVMSVWCIDKQAWRAFKPANVISVKASDE